MRYYRIHPNKHTDKSTLSILWDVYNISINRVVKNHYYYGFIHPRCIPFLFIHHKCRVMECVTPGLPGIGFIMLMKTVDRDQLASEEAS